MAESRLSVFSQFCEADTTSPPPPPTPSVDRTATRTSLFAAPAVQRPPQLCIPRPQTFVTPPTPPPRPPPLPPIVVSPQAHALGSTVYNNVRAQLMDHNVRSVMLPTAQPHQYKLEVFSEYYFYVENAGIICVSSRMSRVVSVLPTWLPRRN